MTGSNAEKGAGAEKTDYVYDQLGRLFQVILPAPVAGAARPTTTYQYDANGNTRQVTDALGSTTEFFYDRLDRQILRSEPATSQHTAPIFATHYYADGSVSASVAFAGTTEQRVTSWQYDNRGRVLQQHLPTVAANTPVRSWTYDVIGRQRTATDEVGDTTQFAYDNLNRHTVTIRPHSTFERRYNTYGNLVLEIDAFGQTKYAYDYADRLVSVQRLDLAGTPLAPAATKEYDRLGRLIAEIDGQGARTTYTYDNLNRVVRVDYANGEFVTLGYDLLGRQNRVEDALGNVTWFDYDDLDRLAVEETTVGGVLLTRSYQYDLVGNLIRVVDRQGRVRDYQYDTHYQKTDEWWYTDVVAEQAGQASYTLHVTYNVVGLPIAMYDNSSSYDFTYDALDRLKDVIVTNPGVPTVTLSNFYDQSGYDPRLDSLRLGLLATINGLTDFQNIYTYDENLRLRVIEQDGPGGAFGQEIVAKRVELDYDAADRLTGIVRYQNGSLVAASVYRYDDLHRLTSLTHAGNSDDTLAFYNWTFDAAHRVDIFTSIDGVVDYNYDDNGQLTVADYDYQQDESYVYDLGGNRVQYTVGDHNRVLSDGVFTYEYDAEGNRTRKTEIASGAVTEYGWDIQNRLIRITQRESATGAVTSDVQYTYDMFGRRISKWIDADGDGAADREERYVYDGENIVLQFDGGGQLTHRYLHGPQVDQILTDEQFVAGAWDRLLWPLADNLGSIRDLAEYDETTGTTSVVSHLIYDAFGSITVETDASVEHLYAYTGRERDTESDLQYNRARYYDPALGQWISEDPIAFAAGDFNIRRYVSNSPTTYRDPTGHE